MSATIFPMAVYGLKVDMFDMIRPTGMKICGHEIEDSFKFCPACGKPNESEVDFIIPINESEDDEVGLHCGCYPDVESTVMCEVEGVVGFLLTNAYSDNPDPFCLAEVTDEMKSALIDKLVELGINFDVEDFHTYVIQYYN